MHPRFARDAFITDALAGYDALELMPRARQIAAALRRHLPQDYPAAAAVLLDSIGPRLVGTASATSRSRCARSMR